jgi:hypothetical protein
MTAENVRCKGRPADKRCRTPLLVGSWFWLEGKKPYCETCATDPEQELNAPPNPRSHKRYPMVSRHTNDVVR